MKLIIQSQASFWCFTHHHQPTNQFFHLRAEAAEAIRAPLSVQTQQYQPEQLFEIQGQIERDLPETCDEFMTVEPGASSSNPSTVCLCVLKGILCVGHVSNDGRYAGRQTDDSFLSTSVFLQKKINFLSTCNSPVCFLMPLTGFTKSLPKQQLSNHGFVPIWKNCFFFFPLFSITKYTSNCVCLSVLTYYANMSIFNTKGY